MLFLFKKKSLKKCKTHFKKQFLILYLYPTVLQSFSGSKCNLKECFVGKAAHAEQLQFREQALVALLSMLGENIQRYREESTKLDHLTEKLSNGMPGKSQLDNRMVITFSNHLIILRPDYTAKRNQS